MRRHFAAAAGIQLHYVVAGSGPALVILPPLPSTARTRHDLIARLARNFTVFAVDPPGHGFSDAAAAGAGLTPYIVPIAAFCRALGVGPVVVAGEGAGAVLAFALTTAHRELVRACLLVAPSARDPLAPNTDDLIPRRDGAHLLAYWDRISSAYLASPWQSGLARDRLQRDMPAPGVIHTMLVDYLRAWRDGGRFRHAAAELSDAWRQGDHPATVRIFDDTAAMTAAAINIVPASAAVAPTLPPSEGPDLGTVRSYLVDVDGGQLLARGNLGPGRLVLGLHDQAGAHARLNGFLAPFRGDRPTLALDMPGSGGSDVTIPAAEISIERYAEVVEQALDALGIDEIDIIGRYAGGQTGVELALRRPTLVRHVVNAGVMIFDDAGRADHLANYTPSIAPKWDGSHLVTTWMAFRSMNLWWPWYNHTAGGVVHRDADLRPQVLHDRIVDVLAVGDGYRDAYRASFVYPMAERLAGLTIPCLLTDIPGTASYARVAEAQAAAPRCEVADLSENPADWHGMLAGFFAA